MQPSVDVCGGDGGKWQDMQKSVGACGEDAKKWRDRHKSSDAGCVPRPDWDVAVAELPELAALCNHAITAQSGALHLSYS